MRQVGSDVQHIRGAFKWSGVETDDTGQPHRPSINIAIMGEVRQSSVCLERRGQSGVLGALSCLQYELCSINAFFVLGYCVNRSRSLLHDVAQSS